MKSIITLCLLILMVGCSTTQAYDARLRPDDWAKPIVSIHLDNWYQVDDHVYRSEQPDDEAMAEIEKFGIKHVLNLREFHDDEDEVSKTHLVTHHVPIRTSEISDKEVLAALSIIKNVDEPVLVHCWHGADRTGTIIAMYRIVEQGWSKQDAINELVQGGYNYHAVFDNIITYIQNADIVALKLKLEQRRSKPIEAAYL